MPYVLDGQKPIQDFGRTSLALKRNPRGKPLSVAYSKYNGHKNDPTLPGDLSQGSQGPRHLLHTFLLQSKQNLICQSPPGVVLGQRVFVRGPGDIFNRPRAHRPAPSEITKNSLFAKYCFRNCSYKLFRSKKTHITGIWPRDDLISLAT